MGQAQGKGVYKYGKKGIDKGVIEISGKMDEGQAEDYAYIRMVVAFHIRTDKKPPCGGLIAH